MILANFILNSISSTMRQSANKYDDTNADDAITTQATVLALFLMYEYDIPAKAISRIMNIAQPNQSVIYRLHYEVYMQDEIYAAHYHRTCVLLESDLDKIYSGKFGKAAVCTIENNHLTVLLGEWSMKKEINVYISNEHQETLATVTYPANHNCISIPLFRLLKGLYTVYISNASTILFKKNIWIRHQ